MVRGVQRFSPEKFFEKLLKNFGGAQVGDPCSRLSKLV